MAEQNSDSTPRVIVARRVIDKIVRGAKLYPDPETGEAMIGLILPQAGRVEPDIYILDTISPGEYAVREWGMFEQGDDWQGDVFQWLHVNWEAFRQLRRGSYGNALGAKWDTPLMHVGDWHKQPDDMIAPSGGDAQTARRMIADSETPIQQLVAPIVTMYPLKPPAPPIIEVPDLPDDEMILPAAVEEETVEPTGSKAPAIEIELPADGWKVRIDFWYMSKRSKRFVSIEPVVWDNDRLPGLPPVAWHLLHPKRFDQEFSLLTQAGYTVDIVRWDADGKPPFEICFSIYRPGSSHVIVLVTPVDYPARMPAVRVAPLVTAVEGEDLFEKLYEASKSMPVTQMPDWTWDSKRTLLEIVWHIEKVLKEDTTS